MKKFIFAIYVVALIVMIPAIFIGYLNNNHTTNKNQPEVNQAKTRSSGNNDETSLKPGIQFVLKGV